MKKLDYAWIGGLVLAGIYIWARNQAWASSADETLPILAGLALFVWLPWPWNWAETRHGARRVPCVAGLAVGLLGLLLDSTLLLAIAWTCLLWSWISVRMVSEQREPLRKLMVLPLLSFPWMVNDFSRLSWYFRLSAAAATEKLLGWTHFHVLRQGTFLTVNGFALSVEPACSGLNGLQTMLTAGAALAYLRLKRSNLFWPALLLLPLAAWIANLMRVLFASVLGASLSPQMAQLWVGPLHLVAGWIAIAIMFGVCAALFSAAQRHSRDAFWWRALSLTRRPQPRSGPKKPYALLELALISYAGWESRSLLLTWRHAPFEQLAGIAFVLWLLPAVVPGLLRLPYPHRWQVRVPWLEATGLSLALAGQLGDLNLLRQAGLAAVLAATAPSRRRSVWAPAAICWMSGLGWIGSELGVSPGAVAVLRVAIAAGAVAAEFKRTGSTQPSIQLAYARAK